LPNEESRAEIAKHAEKTAQLPNEKSRAEIAKHAEKTNEGSGCSCPAGTSRVARGGGSRDLKNKQRIEPPLFVFEIS
jgi:hypothetical protein